MAADLTLGADSKRVVSPPRSAHGELSPPLQPGELEVFEFFDRYLPPAWEIYLQPFLNGQRPDFVLLHPEVGIAVFEVKDWDLNAMEYLPAEGRNDAYIRVRDRGGRWFHKESPLAQANRYRKEIASLYVPALGIGTQIAAVTAGVIFTSADTADVRELLEPSMTDLPDAQRRYTTLSGVDLLQQGNLEEVFPDALRESSFIMSPELAEDLRLWLVEPEHAREKRSTVVLDRRQRDLAYAASPPTFRRVRGPAGSGKSLVLAARAAQLANEGSDVLVVTFNHTLRTYLADLTVRSGGRRNAVTWLGFHEWCKRTMYQAGRGDEYRELAARIAWDPSVLGDKIAKLTLEAITDGVTASEVPRYDAILVDEGQDFFPTWWAALRAVRRSSGEMLLVADRAQDIYERDGYWTVGAMAGAGFVGPWNELHVSYRMPPDLTELVRGFRRAHLPLRDEVHPEPDPQQQLSMLRLRWRQTDPERVVQACLEEVDSVVTGGAFSDLCIVTCDKTAVRAVVSALERKGIGCIDTVDDDYKRERQKKQTFFRGDGRVKVTTIHSFKGWEVPRLVVLLDDAKPELVYTALSRLSVGEMGSALSVVCGVDTFAEHGATWPQHHDDRIGSQ